MKSTFKQYHDYYSTALNRCPSYDTDEYWDNSGRTPSRSHFVYRDESELDDLLDIWWQRVGRLRTKLPRVTKDR